MIDFYVLLTNLSAITLFLAAGAVYSNTRKKSDYKLAEVKVKPQERPKR